jgi:hypothetical protein
MLSYNHFMTFNHQLYNSVPGERRASKTPKRIEAFLPRLLMLLALYVVCDCAVAVSGAATFRSADDALEEEKRVAAFLAKPDYFPGMRFIDWSREQDRLKFYIDETIPGFMCTIFSPGSASDNMELFFDANDTIPNVAHECRAYNSTIKVMNCDASVPSVGICGKRGGPNMDLLRLIFDGQSACVDTEAAMYLKYGFDDMEMFWDCPLKDSVGPGERHGVHRLQADKAARFARSDPTTNLSMRKAMTVTMQNRKGKNTNG